MNAIRLGTLLIILGLLGTPTESLAQATAPVATGMWAGVERVPPGEKLLVKLKDGKKLKGRLASVSDTGLTLSRKNKTMDVDREKVQQIFRLMPKSATKSALIGAGAGAAGGSAIGAVAGRDAFIKTAASVPIGATLFGGIGGVGGYAVGKARRKRVLIYDAQVLQTLLRPSEAGKRVPRYDLASRN